MPISDFDQEKIDRECKQTEEALRFSEARYRALYRDNPTMIVTLDADLTTLSVNPICACLLGYMIDELEGQPAVKIFHEDDRPAVTEQLQICMQNPYQVYHWQFRKIRKDGSLLWVEETAQAVYDLYGVLNILVVCQDITERKQAEEALRFSEARYRALYCDNPTLIATLDADLKTLCVNPVCARLLGYMMDELEGQSVLKLFHEDDRPAVTEQLRICLQNPHQVYHWQFRKIHKDGSLLWVEETARAMFDPHGALNILVVCQDITERKQAKEENERLNIELAARASELEATNQELESFNYTVSHDLRQPLNVISSYCQVIEEMCGNKLGEQCKGFLHDAYEGTWRMNRLIDTLLNFSRLNRVELNREMVDLSAIAKVVAGDLKLADPERLVTCRIAEGIMVDGDAGLLQVVLDNLLGNAWKYTGTQEKAIIEFGAVGIDGKQVCFVRDNGAGFNMADADKLFTPFKRLPGAEKCRGFGVGLATVERIIRRHGGEVWAEGEPGKGATFYFTL